MPSGTQTTSSTHLIWSTSTMRNAPERMPCEFRRYFKNYSSIDIAIAPSEYDSSTWVGAGMYKFNKWTYDFQVLGGWWNEDVALGAGWAGNLKAASFKGEVTYFQPQENFTRHQRNVSLRPSHADYVFKGNVLCDGWVDVRLLGI